MRRRYIISLDRHRRRSPSAEPRLHDRPRLRPKLGLDLQGGASVTLLPEGNVSSDSLGQAVQIIRQRVDALGVAEPEITRQGDAIVVNLPGVKDQDRALQLVGQTAELRFRPVLEVLPPDATGHDARHHGPGHGRAAATTAAGHGPRTGGPTTATTVAGGGPGNAVRCQPRTAPPPWPRPTPRRPRRRHRHDGAHATATDGVAGHHVARERPGRPAGRAAAAGQQRQRRAALPARARPS